MSQQASGLRFDIYERVHLPDNTVGVKEINGIELTPEISVVAQGEQAVLKGYLVLSGTYAGEGETRNEEERLTHRIPVEITLPLSRVENVNDIRVEIENFDVDLLSPRSLNVTGVLSLGGIETASPMEPAWREEEEVVFTHRVEQSPPTPTPAPPPTPEPAPFMAAEAVAPEPEPIPISAPNVAAVSAANEPETALPEANEPQAEAPATISAAENAEPNEEPEAAEALEAAQEPEAAPAPEKQEIKIAFSGKTSESPQAPIGVNAIMSMAGAGAAQTAQAAQATQATQATQAEKRQEPPPQPAAAAETAEGKDRLEWKKLFLQSSADETSFRKVRMCIAQKEDTIETIADRYQKNVRELMLYNRINDQYLQEGQIVYIP
ncbi:LysM peptidoglycan-binding domain-containing protein [Paenibacillus antri]|uniref:LysM peptidoglycan-binding domain-containing protein n=1 Tax=Paenibacillus antri TaxID=2582848 RepID=A0A5R9GEF9_9BACL|nr:LysM peptidoglycan-binding domain-containing protein [Paenibacillus antri]TLS53519.1 LysM peptidoglycan-binding domain-containing protein [Paenibacillus antri]